MSLPLIFMFSGQGSQFYHMAEELFNHNKVFKDIMIKADNVCRDLLDLSIISHIYDQKATKSQPFNSVLITHPAIFITEYALSQLFIHYDIKPDMVLGASLGEFAAAVTAEIMDFETALQSVIKQASLIHKFCNQAGMLAILHDHSMYQTDLKLANLSELAAINFSSHFVVSATNENLQTLINQLNKVDITSQLLPVIHGFHSSLIDPIRSPFTAAIKDIKLSKATIPFISCTLAKILESMTSEYWWEVVRQPIQFQQTIEYIENMQPALYLDLGPSGTLATFVKYNLKTDSNSKNLSILTPFGQDLKQLQKAIDECKK